MEKNTTIELIDYLRVIWKWKWLIFMFLIFFMAGAGVISYMLPKIHTVSMVLEAGIIGKDSNNEFIYLDSSGNVAQKIREGAYNFKIIKKLSIDPLKINLEFRVKIKEKLRFIKIFSEWEDNKIELGLKVFNELYRNIFLEYENSIKKIRENYDKQILQLENEIKGINNQKKEIDNKILLKQNEIREFKNQIEFQTASHKIIIEREGELIDELKNVKLNTEKIVRQRDSLLMSKNGEDNISRLLYCTTVQQNMAYFNNLMTQLQNLKTKREKIPAEIKTSKIKIDDKNTEIEIMKLEKTEGLKIKIDNVNLQIDRSGLQKDLIEGIKLIQRPEVSLRPVKPKIKLNVLISGVIGLIISFFLAFFLEYIREVRARET
ncbi:MAG: Wzz/FepE/Etk N-terminal domain-containing protein [Thermodesulfobacteriota bacterium]|nr:Wzz/FepE/Etk N-terminal domain-containing protein [Thermodesulfobacteriota bacterium]